MAHELEGLTRIVQKVRSHEGKQLPRVFEAADAATETAPEAASAPLASWSADASVDLGAAAEVLQAWGEDAHVQPQAGAPGRAAADQQPPREPMQTIARPRLLPGKPEQHDAKLQLMSHWADATAPALRPKRDTDEPAFKAAEPAKDVAGEPAPTLKAADGEHADEPKFTAADGEHAAEPKFKAADGERTDEPTVKAATPERTDAARDEHKPRHRSHSRKRVARHKLHTQRRDKQATDDKPTFKATDDKPTFKAAETKPTFKATEAKPTFKAAETKPTFKATDSKATAKADPLAAPFGAEPLAPRAPAHLAPAKLDARKPAALAQSAPGAFGMGNAPLHAAENTPQVPRAHDMAKAAARHGKQHPGFAKLKKTQPHGERPKIGKAGKFGKADPAASTSAFDQAFERNPFGAGKAPAPSPGGGGGGGGRGPAGPGPGAIPEPAPQPHAGPSGGKAAAPTASQAKAEAEQKKQQAAAHAEAESNKVVDAAAKSVTDAADAAAKQHAEDTKALEDNIHERRDAARSEREAAKADAKAAQESKTATRESLQKEIEDAQTAELAELEQSSNEGGGDATRALDERKSKLETEAKTQKEAATAALDAAKIAVESKRTAQIAKAQAESKEAARVMREDLGKQKESAKSKGDASRETFLEAGRKEAATTRERTNKEATTTRTDGHKKAADAIRTATTQAEAMRQQTLASAGDKKAEAETLANARFQEAMAAGMKANADIIKTTEATAQKITADGDAAALKAEADAKTNADKATTEAVAAVAAFDTQIKTAEAANEKELAAAAKAVEITLTEEITKAELDNTTALQKIDETVTTGLADIEAERAEAETTTKADLDARKKAIEDKAKAARAKLDSTAEADIASAAKEVRAATADIDKASDALDKDNATKLGEMNKRVDAKIDAHLDTIRAQGAAMLGRIKGAMTAMQVRTSAELDQTLARIEGRNAQLADKLADQGKHITEMVGEAGAKVLNAQHSAAEAERAKLTTLREDADKKNSATASTLDKDLAKTAVSDPVQMHKDAQAAADKAEAERKAAEAAKPKREQLDDKTGKAKLDAMKLSPEKQKLSQEAAWKVRQAMTTMTGTDEDGIHAALKGLSPEDAEAVRAQFAAEGWGDLDVMLAEEMSGTDLAEAQANLSGDKVAAAMAQLDNAADGMAFGVGTNEDKMKEALASLTDPADRARLAEEYQKKHPGETVEGLVKDELSGSDRDLAEAALIQDPREREAKMFAIKMDERNNGGVLRDITDTVADNVGDTLEDNFGVDGKKFRDAVRETTSAPLLDEASSLLDRMDNDTEAQQTFEELEKIKDPEARRRAEEAYQKTTGKNLREDLAEHYGEAQVDAMNAYLDGDPAKARAARAEAAMDSIYGTDEKELWKQLENLSPEERDATLKAYEDKYGKPLLTAATEDMQSNTSIMAPATFLVEAVGRSSEDELKKTQQLINTGKVSPSLEAKLAMSGAGTDAPVLTKMLEGKSKDEIAAMKRDYEKDFPGSDFEKEVLGELDGRDAKLAELAFKEGAPQTADDKVKRLQDMQEFDQSGLLGPLNGDATDDLDKQLGDAKYLADQLKAENLSPEERAKLEAQLDAKVAGHALATTNYKAAQTETVEIANTASDLALTVTGPINQALQRIHNKTLIMGSSYSPEDMLIDVGREAAKMATEQAISAISGPLGPVLGKVLEGMGGGVIDTLFTPGALRDPGDLARMLVKSLSDGAKTGAIDGITGALLDHGMGKMLEDWVPTSAKEAIAKKALESLVSTAAGVAIDPSSGGMRLEDLARKTGVKATKGVLASVQAGDAFNRNLSNQAGKAAAEKVRASGGSEEEQRQAFLDTHKDAQAAQARSDAARKEAEAAGKTDTEIEQAARKAFDDEQADRQRSGRNEADRVAERTREDALARGESKERADELAKAAYDAKLATHRARNDTPGPTPEMDPVEEVDYPESAEEDGPETVRTPPNPQPVVLPAPFNGPTPADHPLDAPPPAPDTQRSPSGNDFNDRFAARMARLREEERAKRERGGG